MSARHWEDGQPALALAVFVSGMSFGSTNARERASAACARGAWSRWAADVACVSFALQIGLPAAARAVPQPLGSPHASWNDGGLPPSPEGASSSALSVTSGEDQSPHAVGLARAPAGAQAADAGAPANADASSLSRGSSGAVVGGVRGCLRRLRTTARDRRRSRAVVTGRGCPVVRPARSHTNPALAHVGARLERPG